MILEVLHTDLALLFNVVYSCSLRVLVSLAAVKGANAMDNAPPFLGSDGADCRAVEHKSGLSS